MILDAGYERWSHLSVDIGVYKLLNFATPDTVPLEESNLVIIHTEPSPRRNFLQR